MPVSTIEKIIDGHDIKIVQFTAVRGFKVKARLLKLILPVLSPMLGGIELTQANAASILDRNIDIEKVLPQALTALSTSLDEEVLFKLLIDLLQSTMIDGKMLDENIFNDVFIANYTFAYKLAYEVIIANNFFDFGGIGNLLKAKMLKQTVSSEEKF